MRKHGLTILFAGITLASFSQNNARKTFLISSSQQNATAYTHIMSVDTRTGKQLTDIFDARKSYRYRPGARLAYASYTGEQAEKARTPMAGAVACMAFDEKNNRLYYIPQQVSELRYVDLNQAVPSFTAFESQSLNLLHGPDDLANQVSRMTMAADGFGYALTNDGEHLIRFSTGETPVIQDLGVLIDNPKNQVMVRSSCTSWGGDLVGAADGSLYLVTVYNHLFRISLPSKQADYIGQIKNLPQEFSSNGASVDEDGKLLVSCGASIGKPFSPVYRVDISTLGAEPVTMPDGVGNIADMASSNLLLQRNTAPASVPAFQQTATNDDQLPRVSIFPNPVTKGRFQIRTSNLTEKGDYRMSLLDATGNAVMEARISTGGKSSNHSFTLPSGRAKGVYFIRIADYFGRTVFSQQLIIE